MKPITAFIILAFPLFTQAQTHVSAKDLYNKMMKAIESVNTCTFTITLEERIFDKMITGRQKVKLQTKPLKVYIHSLFPSEGAEVLYNEGENNGKALINPNRFPFINISLHPTNKLLRKNHQYTVDQMGFGYLYHVLKEYEVSEKERFFSKMKLVIDKDDKHPCCYKLVIDNDEFGFINYKIKSNETITDVARKFYVNDQMILDLNRHISYYDDVYPSQVITIPNSYARRIEFYIDKQTLLPLTQIIYDHKGLFSKVRFTEFRLNPPLSPDEFTRDYKAYGF